MDFYEGNSIGLDPKGYTRFDGQKRGQEGRAFQETRTDQPKQRHGVQRVHGMLWGLSIPLGLECGYFRRALGAGGGDKTAKGGGPRVCRL